ncbi:MAG: ribbon-helix-helix protein, CopG family [Chlamydiota bacterium]
MAKAAKKQIGLKISAPLYRRLSKLAEDNGQSKTFVLEKAVEHYINFVAPDQGAIRPEAMVHFRKSVEKNRELYQRLAR